jgi:hypothetical protein
MAQLVCTGASLTCSFGVAPGQFIVLPTNRVAASNIPAATIMDNVPMSNIMPFGMCTTASNPQVAAATAAAGGVLTPVPCIPVTTTPWTPGSPTVLINGTPGLNSACQLNCTWGGMITVSNPGQQTVNLP